MCCRPSENTSGNFTGLNCCSRWNKKHSGVCAKHMVAEIFLRMRLPTSTVGFLWLMFIMVSMVFKVCEFMPQLIHTRCITIKQQELICNRNTGKWINNIVLTGHSEGFGHREGESQLHVGAVAVPPLRRLPQLRGLTSPSDWWYLMSLLLMSLRQMCHPCSTTIVIGRGLFLRCKSSEKWSLIQEIKGFYVKICKNTPAQSAV